ncbi:hypothetical protein HGB13_04000 [bacterium]|nr:hypothetical protein [bacterium]
MVFRIFMTALWAGAGFTMIMYTRQVADFTGTNSWIENNIGSGQTYNFIKIMGMLFIFGAFLYLIGQFDWIFAKVGKL